MRRKYTVDEIRNVLQLTAAGLGPSEIAHTTSVPRHTVVYWRRKGADSEWLARIAAKRAPLGPEWLQPHQFEAYAYLLGMYLGDGYIATEPRTYRLRIFLDKTQPHIIQECAAAIQAVVPQNRVGVIEMKQDIEVNCYWNGWPALFPQCGRGKKHNRKIELSDWQKKIVEQFPSMFIRGCIHSDGCRHRRIVNGKDYPAYAFTNTSADILQLFMWACDLAGIHYTRANAKNVSIARRADVAHMDEIVGVKT
jgi:hypothetical protein